MPWHDCDIDTAAAAGAWVTPGTASILNPARQNPEDAIRPQFQIKIESEGQWWEHNHFYRSGTLRGTRRGNMEIDSWSFELFDTGSESTQPFINGPREGQRIRLYNGSGTRIIAKGYIERPPRHRARNERENLTDRKYMTVHCVNELTLMQRAPIDDVLRNMKESAQLAQLTAIYAPEFDISGINLDIGILWERRGIANQPLFQLYQEFLRRNPDVTFFLDIRPEKSKIYLDYRANVEAQIGVSLTDQNLYEYCIPGNFSIASTTEGYRNEVRVRYPRLYSRGTCNVDLNGTIVYGFDTKWFGNAFTGNRFRLKGSEHTYSVTKNNSTQDELVEELYINAFQQATVTGVEYELIGEERVAISEDLNEIERLASERSEYGPHGGLRAVTVRVSEALTDEEAQQMADALFKLRAWDGEWVTDNVLVRDMDLWPGKVVECSLDIKFQVSGLIPIQTVDWQDGGAYRPEFSGQEDPYLKYRISFTDRALLNENVVQQLILAQRSARARDSADVEISKSLAERFLAGDCWEASGGEPADEQWEASDAWRVDQVQNITGPWAATPTDPGQYPIIAVDLDAPQTYWFAT